MRVDSWEEGDRPLLFTRARMWAPQAKLVITELLASKDFADHAFVVLDWAGTIAFTDGPGTSLVDGALDKALPVLYIQVRKDTAYGVLRVETRLDVDEVFSNNTITVGDFVEILRDIEERVEQEIAQRAREVN